MYPWTLRLVRGQGRLRREAADAIPRFGERHPAMHRATFTAGEHDWEQPLCFVFAFLLAASTWYHPYLIFHRPSAFAILCREAFRGVYREEKLRRFFSLITYIFFEDIDRFLRIERITKVYRAS